jgi:dihydrofolate synthase/folylpolyglutamate synthase
MPTNTISYQETLNYLFGLQRFGIKLGLTNISILLRELGNPQSGLPAVHIAGSNGKGSTAAFLTSILRQGGWRVGLYTSPHLIDFTERIQVNGQSIPVSRVVELTEHIRGTVDKLISRGEIDFTPAQGPLAKEVDLEKAYITFFEFTTAMAFLYFREKGVDIAVIETGLGGRLDATNVIDPLISLITSISLEHKQYLGRTLRQIAWEKAGIIKPQRPVFTSAHQPKVLEVLRQRCAELNSPFYIWRKDFQARRRGPGVIDFRGRKNFWPNLTLGLWGSHQIVNASLALVAAEALSELGYSLAEEHIRKGVRQVKWPGRLEIVGENPRVLLDGAHNPAGTKVLKKALQEGFPRQRLILVLGIMGDKDIRQMMANLVPLADFLILTKPKLERSASLEVLKKEAAIFRKNMTEIPDVAEALERALAIAEDKDLILVSGSLFTVGEARAHLIQKGLIES